MQKKRCRIYAGLPITCFEVPIIGETELNLTPDEIYKCLCSKAEVIEILPDGSHINLDFTNYNKDNRKEEPVLEETIKPVTVVPVVETTPEPKQTPLVSDKSPETVVTVVEETKDEIKTEEEVVIELEDKVEIQEEVEELEEELESVTDEEVNETSATPVKATTVSEYQVPSRNNNNYKNQKNKK